MVGMMDALMVAYWDDVKVVLKVVSKDKLSVVH